MAEPLLKDRVYLSADRKSFAEFKIHRVPKSEAFPDGVKYSMSFVQEGKCVLRYDNELGKRHHRHFGKKEGKVKFESIERLVERFLGETEKIRTHGSDTSLKFEKIRKGELK